MTLTVQEIKDSVLKNKIKKIDRHTCILCGTTKQYLIIEKELFYDSLCRCTFENGGINGVEWEHLQNWLVLHNEEEQKKILSQ